MSAPTVPPRPQRAQAGPTAVQQQQQQPQLPQIPPRPLRKIADLEAEREASVRSPLNEPPTAMSTGSFYSHSNTSGSEIRRPPSVSLPSIGQEGSEYASYDQLPPEAHGVAADITADGERDPGQQEQVRHAGGLTMHAPKASVPLSTASARIQPVTRTDSSQAVAAGIGKAPPQPSRLCENESSDSLSLSRTTSREMGRVASRESKHPLREKSSFNRSTSSLPKDGSTPRPPSIYGNDEEQGIPSIGMQIPLLKYAGDVQAPSPGPGSSQHTPGIGFWNDGSTRHHGRKRSSRHEFKFDDQYGRHHEGADRFEKDWAARHPKEALREGHNLQLPRPETALSSDQLNRLVRDNDDIGMGTSPAAVGTPSQEIGWAASDQYALRMVSPKPSPTPLGSTTQRRSSSGTQKPIGSPLRRSFQTDEGNLLGRSRSHALDSDDDVIHIDPSRRGNKVTGGGPADNTVDLGPTGGNTAEEGGFIDELGPGIPILASDEIIKRPGSAFLQPAVNPEADEEEEHYYPSSRRNSSQPTSRPSSRPNSVHGAHGYGYGGGLHRFISHEQHDGSGMGTPLEEIEEYEPLFPEDEKDVRPKMENKLKQRPGLAHHHFPSQDVWEDTPASLKYETYVETPEPAAHARDAMSAGTEKPAAASAFETPEQEAKRKAMNDNDMTSDSKTFAKPHFKSGVQSEMSRPGVQRFPSQDIWEDTPSSMMHVTTVSGPQEDEIKSPEDDRPTTFALPGSQDDSDAAATTGMSQLMGPQIPSRPARRSKLSEEMRPPGVDPREQEVPDLGAKESSPTKAQAPTIPGRPKPTIPARPARKPADDANGAPLDKSISADSTGSQDTVKEGPPVPKAKPSIPARPAGSKIAALQAGFMQDLNSRLKLGPQGPPPKAKEPEPEVQEEKEPLADARKGRARGPPRRAKPAASTSPSKAGDTPLSFSFCTPVTMWVVDEADELSVPAGAALAADHAAKAEKAMTANVTKNAYDASPAVSAASQPTPLEDKEDVDPLDPLADKLVPHVPDAIGHAGDTPDASISRGTVEAEKAIRPEMEASLAEAEDAPSSAEALQAQDAAELAAAPPSAAVGGEQEGLLSSPKDSKDPKDLLPPAPEAGMVQEQGVSAVADGDEAGNTSANLV